MVDWDARLKGLQSHWRKAAAAAEKVGYVKPDELSWDEAAIEIIKLEQSSVGNPDDVPVDAPASMPEYPVQGIYPTAWYRANNVPVCSMCGEQYLSDGRSPLCAEGFPANVCPRLEGND